VTYLFVGKLKLSGSAIKERVVVVLPEELIESYEHVFYQILRTHASAKGDSLEKPPVQARIYIGRVFNENGEVVIEVNSVATVNVEHCPSWFSHGLVTEYCVDLTELARKFNLSLNYYLEILLFSLMGRTGSLEQREYVVYPYEFRYNFNGVPDKIRVFVESYASSLKKAAGFLELPIILAEIGLEGLSADLVEGLKRFYGGDYEGSIKFFRKVVEGLRNYVREKLVFGSKRDGLLYDYLSKAFQLISNFGEHANTRGSVYEAEFSMEVCLSAVKYISRYLLLESPGDTGGRLS
jgi:hypothetical protein